jgi:hypothetical protein
MPSDPATWAPPTGLAANLFPTRQALKTRRTLLFTGTDDVEIAVRADEVLSIEQPPNGAPHVVRWRSGRVTPVKSPSYAQLLMDFDDLVDAVYVAP